MVTNRHSVLVSVHILLENNGEILLMRRANTGFMDGSLSLPSGHMDAGETLPAAAARELLEETGVHVRTEDLLLHALMHRVSADREYLHTFFRAAAWTNEPRNVEPNKCDLLAWFPRANLPDGLIPYVHNALLAPSGSMLVDISR